VTLFDHRFNQGRRLGLLGGAVAPPKGGTAPPKGTAAPNLEMYMINYKMLKWSWHKRATTSDRGGGGGSEHGSFLPPPKECWNGVPGWVIRSSKSSRSILDAPDLRPGHRLPESSTKQGASCADLSTDDANSNLCDHSGVPVRTRHSILNAPLSARLGTAAPASNSIQQGRDCLDDITSYFRCNSQY